MRISFEPTTIVINDRKYYRPAYGGVAFPKERFGYVLMMLELYKPTEMEVDGRVNTPPLEPYRSMRSQDGGPFRYTEDAVLEVVAEAQCVNLRALEEQICDFS